MAEVVEFVGVFFWTREVHKKREGVLFLFFFWGVGCVWEKKYQTHLTLQHIFGKCCFFLSEICLIFAFSRAS